MSTNGTMASLPCEQPGCPEPATHLAQRIDASQDRLYACEVHAREYTRWAAAEATALPAPRSLRTKVPAATLEMVLTMWPPRHRRATQRAAKALLAKEA